MAGYHSSDINEFVNRNVMSIDSYDWLHRTGANPPNEPSAELCLNRTAQAFKYEGIFAHEYQHLLEYWASPGEATWVNEGLSDYAISVTGYGFPARSIYEVGWDGHIQTFLGWRSLQTPANLIPQPNGGAENSLTVWEDQGGLETLADYGAAWTFMEFLHGRYGSAFMTDFHNEDVNGLAGLQVVLDRYLTGKTTRELIHEWAAMVALDRSIDAGAKIRGAGREGDYQTPTLNAAIHWENPQSYSTPGAPPNGSDYVALRDASGASLDAKESLDRDHGSHASRGRATRVDVRARGRRRRPRLGRCSRPRPLDRPIDLCACDGRPLTRLRHALQHRDGLGLRRRPDLHGRRPALDEHRQRDDHQRHGGGARARSSRSCRASTAPPAGARRRSIWPRTPVRPFCCASGC